MIDVRAGRLPREAVARRSPTGSSSNLVFWMACAVAWFVLLPVLVVGGGIALFLYALLAELREVLFGNEKKPPDLSAAREIARDICLTNQRLTLR